MKSVILSDRHILNQKGRDALHREPDFSGLCDIDRELFRVAKSRDKTLGTWNFNLNYNRYIFVLQVIPNSLTRDLVTLN